MLVVLTPALMGCATPRERYEARLRDFATRTGKNAAQLVEEAVDRMLEYDACFMEAVGKGSATAGRASYCNRKTSLNVSKSFYVRDTRPVDDHPADDLMN